MSGGKSVLKQHDRRGKSAANCELNRKNFVKNNSLRQMVTQAEPTQAFRLRALGEVSLEDAQGRAIKLRTRKALLLLACLVVDPDRSWTRDRLAAIFWGDRMEKQAKSSLRSALSDIRRGINDQAVTVEGNIVRANPEIVGSDIDALRRSVTTGQEMDFDWAKEFTAHSFLSELDPDEDAMAWIMGLRSELTDLATSVLGQNIETLSGQGNFDQAIQKARYLLALDPLREESHRTLMTLYAKNGERSKAIAQFQNCRQLIQHELNVEPSTMTKALADQIAVLDVVAISAIRELISGVDTTLTAAAGPSVSAVEQTVASGKERRSIAVLPFINMSGDANQNYFADGIAEDIVTDLSQIPELDVAASSSTLMFRGGKDSPETIANDLGVEFVLEGSVRKFDRNIRVTIRLIDGKSNHQLWAERYDRELVRIFDLQSEIAASVVSALQLHFVPKPSGSAGARGTRSIEAHECYLRGRAFLKEMTEHSVELSLKSFRAAIELDPNYALALAGFAESVMMLAFHHTASDTLLDEARQCCEKALRIDPALAEAHCSLGRLHAFHNQFERGEEQFQMALRLSPNLQEAHLYRGLMYLIEGFSKKAYPSLSRAYALNDQDLQTSMMFLHCQQAVGDTDAAQNTAEKSLRLCRKRIELNPYDDRAIYVGAMSLVTLGQKAEATRWGELAATFDPDDGRTTYNIACLFGQLNDFESAEPFIRKTLDLGVSDHKVRWFRYIDRDFQLLRSDPRFDAIFTDWEQAQMTGD